MAGDWIKIRHNLDDDPHVLRLLKFLPVADVDHLIGKLRRLWKYADMHTVDGFIPFADEGTVDKITGLDGFSAALSQVGWIEFRPEGAIIPRFTEHNGASAKKRARDTIRKADERAIDDPKKRHYYMAQKLKAEILARDRFRCAYCGFREGIDLPSPFSKRDDWLTIDHIIPRSSGGTDEKSNLVTACFPCNNSKNDRTLEEAGMKLKFLSAKAKIELGFVSAKTRTERGPEKRRSEKNLEEENSFIDSSPPNPPHGLLADPEFIQVWDRWKRHRKEIRHPVTGTSEEAKLKELESWGKTRAIAAIEHSIANGWQGIFERETKANGNGLVGKDERFNRVFGGKS